MVQRFKGIANILASKGMMDTVDVDSNIKNLYFDIAAGDSEPITLDMLMRITDKKHIVFGTDYPHSPATVVLNKKEHFENNPKYKDIIDDIYEINGKKLLK